MLKESAKKSITNFDFLNLLSSTIVLQDKTPIFENWQLQKDLYDFYDNQEFHFLFEDVCKKESIEGNNYVDLENAFQLAYAWGLLSMIQDSGNLKSIINLSKEESLENISRFDQRQICAINELVTQLYLPKKIDKSRLLVKR